MGAYVNQGAVSDLTNWRAVADDDGVNLLTRRWDPVNGKGYVKVKASAASYSCAANHLMSWEATSSVGIVKVTTATGDLRTIAGVSLAANGTASYYGYIQDYGAGTCNVVASAALSIGDQLVASLSSTGSLIQWLEGGSISLVSPVIATVLTAISASVSGDASVFLFIDRGAVMGPANA